MAAIDVGKLLSQAVGQLNTDQIEAAEALLQQIPETARGIPQALMLVGVVRLRQKRFDEAEVLFRQVLEKQPGQPATLYYLGNALREKGAVADAVATYRKALDARPDFDDAILALATALRTSGQFSEAKTFYQRLISRTPQSAEVSAGLGAVLVELEEFVEAEKILSAALKLPTESDVIADIECNLGTAKMSQRRFAEALPHFERAAALAPGHLAAERNRARVLEYLNQPARAADSYRRALAKDPLDLKTHLLLNELLHRSGKQSDMLLSYDDAGRAKPGSPIPLTAKGDQLMLLERPADAAENYRRALRLAPDHIAAHIGLSRALSALGDLDGALRGFESATNICPEDADLETAFAYALLRQGDAGKALTLAERAASLAPANQAALAVLGLCYRAKKDDREERLNGYENFVRIFDLEPPGGYPDIASFHNALRPHLEALHGQTKKFFSQTLRGGTRTVEDIFALHHPLRDGLKQRVAGAVTRYIGEMREDTGHPFLSRRTSGTFRFSGSWSSRMCGGGFHVNHIHSGWISSVYYVDVPEISGSSNEGWLKFGEPSADLNFGGTVRRIVQPKPGRLVLFPSYLWHGTIPFNSGETRMTIAFDAVPSSKI